MITGVKKEEVKSMKKIVITSSDKRVCTFFEFFKRKELSYTDVIEMLIKDIGENGSCTFDLQLMEEMAKDGLINQAVYEKAKAEEEAKKRAEEEAKKKNPPSNK